MKNIKLKGDSIQRYKTSNGFVALIVFVLIIVGLTGSLIATKPDDLAFMSYLMNGNRIQAEVASHIEPGDTLTAMALMEDIFSIVAAGDFDKLAPVVQKKDYLLFSMYSVETKSKNNTSNQLSAFKKVDAAQAMGFNSTYIGICGSFFRLKNQPIQNGIPVNFHDEAPTIQTETEPTYVNNKVEKVITFKKAVSILTGIPEIAKEMEDDSNDVLAFAPGNDDGRYERINGEDYISVNLIEDQEDHVVTRQRYFVSLNGKQVLLWDLENDEYRKLNSSKVNQFNPNGKKISEKSSRLETFQVAQKLSESTKIQDESDAIQELEDSGESRDVTFLDNPAPAYPRLAQDRGLQGQVLLKVLISTDGLPQLIEIEKSSGYKILDDAALSAVKRWKFKPALHEGKAISSSKNIPITFAL